MLLASRVPRTLALLIAGSALSIAGLLMQMLARNRYVEPSTAGTVESASLGLLAAVVFFPAISVLGKMMVASFFALAGTALFLVILRSIPHRTSLLVPLVGLMLGGVIQATTMFFAYRLDLVQSLMTWAMGDFSSVLRGRYELIWIAFGLTCAAYFTADKFTLLGMGESFTTNLGVNFKQVLVWGLTIVSLVTATIVVTVGMIPFLGLIIPNLVSLIFGDNLKRTAPYVAIFGAIFVVLCDIVGRLIRFPYEIPIATISAVLGSLIFLILILRQRQQHV